MLADSGSDEDSVSPLGSTTNSSDNYNEQQSKLQQPPTMPDTTSHHGTVTLQRPLNFAFRPNHKPPQCLKRRLPSQRSGQLAMDKIAYRMSKAQLNLDSSKTPAEKQ